jgi:UDP-N-acetylmuramoyl-L-alanyl-D-glutamate--2,6-diaminopimelate ligase
MILADLLDGLTAPEAISSALRDRPVSGLTADSRKVTAGMVFFAIPGSKMDGTSFVPQALAAGASAVVAERGTGEDGVIVVPDVRAALARGAARFFPRQPATIVAVTGTSGKTSVTTFVRQIWASSGHAAASLGTIGVVAPGGSTYGSLTTPDPVTLHRTLDGLAADGVTHLAVEASSHGLDQRRLDGLRLAAGAFTNLSHDHLDYHADAADYLRAKLRLFDTLLQARQPAVIDADHPVAAQVIGAARARGLDVFTVGRDGHDLHLQQTIPTGFATELTINHAGRTFELLLPLAGAFQVSNALVAAGLCLATGSGLTAVVHALTLLEGAPGRLDRVGDHAGAPVFVDYAHKPDALDKVLATLRPYAKGRLVVVFGCGGDRDAAKRPLMGAIATRGADIVIVTDDNPRSEDPAAIRAAILAAAPGAIEIGDRRAAIEAAVALLRTGDVLVIAGKGHETGQIVGPDVLPFSDHETARAALAQRGQNG